MTTKTGTGTRSESIATTTYWGASLEGGDLRKGLAVVAEYREEGSFSSSSVITIPTTMSWDSVVGYFGEGDTMTSVVTSSGQRDLRARLSAWSAGTELALSPATSYDIFNTSTIGSRFARVRNFGLNHVPHTTALRWFEEFPYFAPSSQPAYSSLPPLVTTAPSMYNYYSPTYACGSASANQCAFSPDGTFGYFAIGSFFQRATGNINQQAIKAYWKMPDVAWTQIFSVGPFDGYNLGATIVGGKLKISDPANLCVSAPLFVNNAPTELP